MAAPLGWKDFASGDVLTAADMDGYVMAQIIGVFTDATARDASITSPQEGQHAWLKSDDSLYYVNAAGAWVASPVGDITGITTASNSGMAGGASSGTATISVDANNLSSVTGAVTDYMIIEDVTDNTTKKALISDIVSAGDITGVTAGTAMSGGGTSGTVTVNVDANAAGAVTAVAGDYVLIEDVDDNSTKKALISDIVSLAGDITAVTVTAPITGGGTSGSVGVGLNQANASLLLHTQVFG